MIYEIFQTYFSVLVPIIAGSFIIFLTGLYWILSSSSHQALPPVEKIPAKKPVFKITNNDIEAIAGDDAMSTQLDLARAYIEAGRKQLAKKILDHVVLQGSDTQQQEAQALLNLCV